MKKPHLHRVYRKKICPKCSGIKFIADKKKGGSFGLEIVNCSECEGTYTRPTKDELLIMVDWKNKSY